MMCISVWPASAVTTFESASLMDVRSRWGGQKSAGTVFSSSRILLILRLYGFNNMIENRRIWRKQEMKTSRKIAIFIWTRNRWKVPKVAVLRIRIRMVLGLPDPNPLSFCTDPDPSINHQQAKKVRKTLISTQFRLLLTFYLWKMMWAYLQIVMSKKLFSAGAASSQPTDEKSIIRIRTPEPDSDPIR